jgi:tetratricopeptide (TPR) repeat protein
MKAMKLDSTLAEVHLELATHYFYEWNWKAFESEILRTLRINPNIAISHARYSNFLIRRGRSKDGMEQMDLARKLDPIDPDIKAMYCYALLILHHYPEAIITGREVLKIDPENVVVKGCLAQALYLDGNHDEALTFWKSLYRIMYPKFSHAFDKGFERSGYPGALNSEADTLAAQSGIGNINPGDIAILYAAAENKEKALNFWELAFREHDINMILINDPVNDFLKDEPRYQYLCRQMGLPTN